MSHCLLNKSNIISDIQNLNCVDSGTANQTTMYEGDLSF